jgi:hypothetical protein
VVGPGGGTGEVAPAVAATALENAYVLASLRETAGGDSSTEASSNDDGVEQRPPRAYRAGHVFRGLHRDANLL